MKGSAWGFQFFSFWEGPWGGIFGFFSLFPSCSLFVPMRFPKGCPSSQVVPQNILNSTSVLSHMVCTKFNSHVYKLSIFVSILQPVVQRGASIGECPRFQKNWWWAYRSGPFRKPKKKVVSAPMNTWNIPKYSLFFFTIFFDLEEIIFENFNISQNNIIGQGTRVFRTRG